MQEYITVRLMLGREKATCGLNDECDDPTHKVRVLIGPGILDPFETLLNCIAEAHGCAMEAEGGMTQHRIEEPRCSYCSAIKKGVRTLKAIKGKAL